jgi:GNAT superfamily N-acetyltransferase
VRPDVTLLPLTDADYLDFVEAQVAEHARQRVSAGEWTPDEAAARAREDTTELRADTLRGAGHAFYKGVDAAGAPVGWLWVAPGPAFLERYAPADLSRARWLGQITVEEPLRGRGYGGALLDALHRLLASEGVAEIYLRVYDWDEAARRLYAGRGYEVVARFPTDAHMRRRLDPRSRSRAD